MSIHEGEQSWREPLGGKGWTGGNHQHVFRRVGGQLIDRNAHARKRLTNVRKQRFTLIGQRDGAIEPHKELRPQPLLQGPHLVGNRRRRKVQLLRGSRETHMARGRFKGLQAVQGWQARHETPFRPTNAHIKFLGVMNQSTRL